jgi:hypothetical protein
MKSNVKMAFNQVQFEEEVDHLLEQVNHWEDAINHVSTPTQYFVIDQLLTIIIRLLEIGSNLPEGFVDEAEFVWHVIECAYVQLDRLV